jgi:cytochrome c551/c552
MAADDSQTLISEGACFACYGASTFEILKLALLARISKAHNAANNVTPQGLISQGACLECFGMVSIPKLMELVLLTQIST